MFGRHIMHSAGCFLYIFCRNYSLPISAIILFSYMIFLLDSWMQQSAAFKILRTRLKTVPSYSFGGDQFKRTSSGNPYSQILQHIPSGSQISEDGDVNQEVGTSGSHNGINFALRLQQFEQMQRQHRMHAKVLAESRNSSTSSSKVC